MSLEIMDVGKNHSEDYRTNYCSALKVCIRCPAKNVFWFWLDKEGNVVQSLQSGGDSFLDSCL